MRIDYFAVSLPELMIFDDDLEKRNRIHCHYLQGLGYLGMREAKRAVHHLAEAWKEDRAHMGVRIHYEMI